MTKKSHSKSFLQDTSSPLIKQHQKT